MPNNAFTDGFVGDLVKSAILILVMAGLALSVIPFVVASMVMFGFIAICDYLVGEG